MSPTAQRDYYEILGVERDADEAAIKKAYRQLAMKYHPDRNPGDQAAAQRMAEINEAYAVLSDKEKRRLYDTYGHAGLQGYSQDDLYRGVDFSSIFEDLFGGGIFGDVWGRRGGAGPRSRRGADLRYDLAVSLEDVAFGAGKTIKFSRMDKCANCNGTGAAPGGIKQCAACHGAGQVVSEQRSGFTVFRQVSTCPACRGAGSIISKPCETCKGQGAVKAARELEVEVPKGADTGHAVRVSGEGEAGEPAGDLYVVLQVARHPVFERRDDDIYLVREVSFVQAALGTKLADVPGLEGQLDVDIPAGTQPGDIIKLGGKGIPHLKGHGRGHEYVVVKVTTPTRLSKREKELLGEFQEERDKHKKP